MLLEVTRNNNYYMANDHEEYKHILNLTCKKRICQCHSVPLVSPNQQLAILLQQTEPTREKAKNIYFKYLTIHNQFVTDPINFIAYRDFTIKVHGARLLAIKMKTTCSRYIVQTGILEHRINTACAMIWLTTRNNNVAHTVAQLTTARSITIM